MRNISIIIFSLFLLNNSCSKNDPTGPIVVIGEPVAIAIIGPDGGALETEDFKLTIPPGAFNDSQDLQLFIESDNSVLGDNAASNLYKIEGITEGFKVPVEIKIRYNTTLSGENYIMIGDSTTISTIDTTYSDMAYFPLDATESNGFLTGKLPSQNHENNNKFKFSTNMVVDKRQFTLGLITGGENYNHQHFLFKRTRLRELNDTQASQLLNGFETSYDRFYTLLYPDMDQLTNIIPVHIEQLISGGNNFFVSFNSGVLSINKIPYIVVGWDENLVKPEHIFYNVNPIVGRYIHQLVYEIDETNIFGDAVIEWSQWYGYEYDYWKKYAETNIIEKGINRAFHYLFVWTYEIANGLMVEYLVDRYGDNIIRDILQKIEDDSDDDNFFNAMISKTNHPKVWLADFYEYLLLNSSIRERISYSHSLIDFWKKQAVKKIQINSDTVELNETANYKDLSANIFNIQLSDKLQDGSSLNFSTVGSDTKISVFRYNDSDIEFLDSSDNSITINSIKKIADHGYNLFVLVTNLTSNIAKTSNSISKKDYQINLKIKQSNTHRICTVTYGVAGEVEASGYSTDELNGKYDHYITDYLEKSGDIGTEVFYTSWDYTEADNQYTGFISIRFSNEMTNISQLEVKNNWVSLDGNYSTTHELVAYNIPLLSTNQTYFDYEISGDAVCQGHLGPLKYGSYAFDTSRILQEIICEGADDGTPNRIYVKIE